MFLLCSCTNRFFKLTLAPSMFLGIHSAGEHLGHRATKRPCVSFRVSRTSEHLGQVGRPAPGRFVVE